MRIAYVPYLNTYPLIRGLRGRLPGHELLGLAPSRLARALGTGEIDVGLAPVVQWFEQPELRLISDATIACDGAVRSVVLFSKKPLAQIKTLRLEPHSKTSNVLARVILRERHQCRPELIQPPFDPSDAALTEDQFSADACVAIGNRALRMERTFPHELDLGAAWKELTGLPFVFACWFARPAVDTAELAAALELSRDEGVRAVEAICAAAAVELRLPLATCRQYLTRHIRFRLDERMRAGMERFRGYWQELQPREPVPLE